MNIVEQLNKNQTKEVTEFAIGDTVIVSLKIIEGEKTRLQHFEGFVIAKRNRGFNSSFTVRKIAHGVGVEMVFKPQSPLVDKIVVKRKGKVRRAKLYYLRELSGKAARIPSKLAS